MMTGISAEQLGRNLRAARKGLELRQEDVADALGYARTTIVAIEKGERALKVSELKRFAEHYGLPFESLMNDTTEIEMINRRPLNLTYIAVTSEEFDLVYAYRNQEPRYLLRIALQLMDEG